VKTIAEWSSEYEAGWYANPGWHDMASSCIEDVIEKIRSELTKEIAARVRGRGHTMDSEKSQQAVYSLALEIEQMVWP
jgi:hypothetical protein